jgi:hypothetical protein
MLIRCAPAGVAAKEMARFAAITALLPLRRARGSAPWNFRVGLRLQVLRELALTVGPLLRERRTVTRLANVPRSTVWLLGRSTNSPS